MPLHKQMVMPNQKRKGKPNGGVIQIHVTRLCDLACNNCTQASNAKLNSNYPMFITLENFEKAVLSLKDYFGIVGIFGGNPALHPHFPQLCSILRKHIPKSRCGLWCNRIYEHGLEANKTFNPAVSNLNVHMSQVAYDEFKQTWPSSRPFGLNEDSMHGPVYTSLKSLIPTRGEREELIANCDINKHWSAMIGQFRGELRAWFCEIAGAQNMLRQAYPDEPDTGLPVTEGWWKRPSDAYKDQIDYHCHRCGIPLRAKGPLATLSTKHTQMTSDWSEVMTLKGTREPEIIASIDDLELKAVNRATDYLQNAKRKS